MAWIVGGQPPGKPNNINDEILAIPGELSQEEANLVLIQFLRGNLGIACELLLGIKLAKYQEITLYGMFNRNFNMLVWARAGSKSWLTAVYCILKCIFEPDSKILIASSTFRTSRRVFNYIEALLSDKKAQLAAQCFSGTLKRSDEWIYRVAEPGKGTITAVPLSGKNLRGLRASILVCDEFLSLSQEIVTSVLMPFLNSPLDVGKRQEVTETETDLIAMGLLTEDQRVKFPNTAQMFALSSASYKFEYLYETYQLWCDIIDKPNLLDTDDFKQDKNKDVLKNSTYFVSQLSYEALPSHMIDYGAIQMSRTQDGDNSFQREYCAQFVDGGDGYFSPKKMNEATVPINSYPPTKMRSDNDNPCILAFDSNFSNAKNADYFAMCLLELGKDANGNDIAYCIHNYQKAGGNVQGHLQYFYYLLTHFPNIKLIVGDAAGFDQFHGAIQSSELFKSYPKKLELFAFNSEKEDSEWIDMLDLAKKEYNVDTGHIMMKQYFSSKWILRANEYLASCIQYKKLWFASKMSQSENAFNIIQNSSDIPLNLVFGHKKLDVADNEEETLKMGVSDFMEWQDYLIDDVKNQCARIVPQSGGPSGIPRFDLPPNLRRMTSANRPRRDNYTALLLANWGAKIYMDLKDETKTNKGKYESIGFCAPIVTTQY